MEKKSQLGRGKSTNLCVFRFFSQPSGDINISRLVLANFTPYFLKQFKTFQDSFVPVHTLKTNINLLIVCNVGTGNVAN